MKELFENAYVKRLKNKCERLFIDHPREAGETYLQHFFFTLFMALRVIFCGVVLFIHGIFPFLFTKTASSQIERMYLILKKRIPKARLDEIDWEI